MRENDPNFGEAKMEIMRLRRTLRATGVGVILLVLLLLASSLAWAEPLPQPLPPSGSCPHGYSASGSFCVPRQGAQDAIPLPPNGNCPFGWTRSGSFCMRSG